MLKLRLYILECLFLIIKKENIWLENINKGINDEDKDIQGITNGMTLCNNSRGNLISRKFRKKYKVSLTKSSNFIPYLSNKNIALIKIDV